MDKNNGLMIEGNITKQIILFSIPLLFGNLFQQLYNAVDSAIVGQYIGDNALAAVGSNGPVINLIIALFMGIGVGGSVIIGKYYGARDQENLEKSVHTSIAFILIAGVIVTFIGLFSAQYILQLIQVPKEVFNDSLLYLRIYFLGIIFVMFYNMTSGVLRAVGDSTHPLYYLIASCITNIILDYVFVVFFHMGVDGAALATIISQAFAAFLTFLQLLLTKKEYRFSFKKFKIDKACLIEMIKIGIPTGIQNSVVSFSNLIVQGNINAFGSIAMAGCSAYTKIDGFAILPVMSFSMAFTTFTSQNIGAKRIDRVKKGAKIGLILSISTTIVISSLLLLFANNLLNIFTDDHEVIEYGLLMMKCLAPGYILLAVSHAFNGIIRGSGKTTVPMVVMLTCWCVMRMIWIGASVPLFHNIAVVFLGWPITWVASTIWLSIYYLRGKWIPKDCK